MSCEQTRVMLSSGQLDRVGRRHLSGCDACQRWSAALESLRAEAPLLIEEPPPGLLSESLESIRSESATPVIQLAPTVPRRRSKHWLVAAAAVVLFAVAVGALTRLPGVGPDDPKTILVTSANAFSEPQGNTFRFRISGEATARVSAAVAEPQIREEVESEIDLFCSEIPESERSACLEREHQIRSQIRSYQESLRMSRQQVESRLLQSREVKVTFEGEGSVDRDRDRSKSTITYRTSSPVESAQTFEMISVEGRNYFRIGGESVWYRGIADAGLYMGGLSGPEGIDAVISILARPIGHIERLTAADLKETDVAYKLQAGPGSVEATIDSERKLVTELVITHAEIRSSDAFASRVTVQFFGHGEPVVIEEPLAATALDPSVTWHSLVFFRFSVNLPEIPLPAPPPPPPPPPPDPTYDP